MKDFEEVLGMVDVDGKIPGGAVAAEEAAKAMLEHIKLYLEDGPAAHIWDSAAAGGAGLVPTLLLTTKGARSGALRYSPLICGIVEGKYAVIGSGGNEKHPSWYFNLVANPDTEIKVASETKAIRARTAEGGERQRLWDHMIEVYPTYVTYQESTDRKIPVVVFEER